MEVPWAAPFHGGWVRPQVPAYVFARNPRSSRIRPANDRETSRNVGNGWSSESAGQEADLGNVPGSEIGPENTLKVETRIERAAFWTSCPTVPACKVADRYVNQEGRSIVTDTPGAARSRVQCGTTAGHMSSGSEPEALEQAADLRFLSWGGQDLNLRPTDYESAALTD